MRGRSDSANTEDTGKLRLFQIVGRDAFLIAVRSKPDVRDDIGKLLVGVLRRFGGMLPTGVIRRGIDLSLRQLLQCRRLLRKIVVGNAGVRLGLLNTGERPASFQFDVLPLLRAGGQDGDLDAFRIQASEP